MKLLIAIPAYNESKIIEPNVLKLHDYLEKNFSRDDWKIIISDNNSTDDTKSKVLELIKSSPEIEYIFVQQKGKGIAIKTAWEKFSADIYVFMDADLSTDLEALPQLVKAIKDGYDMACGSRFLRESRVQRSFGRKIISWGYHLLLYFVFRLKVKDAPCGFKAINQKIKNEVLPQVQSIEWFFDSELVILAEKMGYKIKEVPIFWREQNEKERKSQVKIFSLAMEYIVKVHELKRRLKKIKVL